MYRHIYRGTTDAVLAVRRLTFCCAMYTYISISNHLYISIDIDISPNSIDADIYTYIFTYLETYS